MSEQLRLELHFCVTKANIMRLVLKGEFHVVLAIVLIKVKGGMAESVLEDIRKIEVVTKANMVTGSYDIIVYAKLPFRADFRRLINELHDIEGLIKTETCIGI